MYEGTGGVAGMRGGVGERAFGLGPLMSAEMDMMLERAGLGTGDMGSSSTLSALWSHE
jgi:hypothetical protein